MGYYLYTQGGSDHGSEDWIRGTCRLLRCRPTVVTASPARDYRRGIGALADLSCVCRPGKEDVCLLPAPRFGPGKRILWGWCGTALCTGAAKKLQAVVVSNTGAYQHLRDAGLKRVYLGPDPLFSVERKLRPLQGLFRRDTVGLCLSGYAGSYEQRPGLMQAAYCRLITDLLATTPFDLVLIPYGSQQNTLLLSFLHRKFYQTGRVFLRAGGDSPSLRGDLSLCRFVIGSAGAAAAWSCGVPALCIGADPYAIGLAADLLGDWQDGVLPAAWIQTEDDLSRAVFAFFRKEDALRAIMATTVPQRRQRSQMWRWETVLPSQ